MAVFRRRIDIIAHPANDTGEVRAALEDDFHHFRVWVRHRAGEITAIGGEALRFPIPCAHRRAVNYSSCWA